MNDKNKTDESLRGVPSISNWIVVSEPKHPRALVVLLHGYGSNEHDLVSLKQSIPFDALILSVRAPIVLTEGSYAWFHLRMKDGELVRNRDEVMHAHHSLSNWIKKIGETYHAQELPLFFIGFSQGAIVASNVALHDSPHVTAVGMLSGRMIEENDGASPQSHTEPQTQFFIGHGTLDEVIPISYAREARNQLQSSQFPCAYHEYEIAHMISPHELNDLREWMLNVRIHRERMEK
jgi:phospholipase/carboxylesterase